jgi:acetate kinase
MMNKKSGILGISQKTSDNRDIEEGARNGDQRCQLIESMICHQLTKYVGAYAAAMGGVDAVVFTGGIGENNPHYRERVAKNIEFMGAKIDTAKNDAAKRTSDENNVSAEGSKVQLLVIPTNEELMIARDTMELCK